jgi:TP901 family phage tail tape measure protein
MLAKTFVSMGKSPEIAGTAINMLTSRLKLIPISSSAARKSFNQLGISMKDYTKLIEGGHGQDAILMVLEALEKVQGVKRSQIMHDIFGERANRHINSLVEGLDTYKANLRLVSDETAYAGSMQREFAARSARRGTGLLAGTRTNRQTITSR